MTASKPEMQAAVKLHQDGKLTETDSAMLKFLAEEDFTDKPLFLVSPAPRL